MHEKIFEHIMKSAMDKLSTNDSPDYWTGYMRGLRRRQKGKKFGSLEEHYQWLTGLGDESREQRSRGYRDGYGCSKNNGDCMTCEYVNYFGLDCNQKSVGLKIHFQRFKKKV